MWFLSRQNCFCRNKVHISFLCVEIIGMCGNNYRMLPSKHIFFYKLPLLKPHLFQTPFFTPRFTNGGLVYKKGFVKLCVVYMPVVN